MYSVEREIKYATESNSFCFLLSFTPVDRNGHTLYEKRDDAIFHITNCPFPVKQKSISLSRMLDDSLKLDHLQ